MAKKVKAFTKRADRGCIPHPFGRRTPRYRERLQKR